MKSGIMPASPPNAGFPITWGEARGLSSSGLVEPAQTSADEDRLAVSYLPETCSCGRHSAHRLLHQSKNRMPAATRTEEPVV